MWQNVVGISKGVRAGFSRCLTGVKALVLPKRCMACGRYMAPLPGKVPLESCFCPQCLDQPLPEFSPPFCPCCGHLFARSDQDNHWCESCLRSPPEIDMVRAAFAYEGIVRTAVALLKYQGRIRLARPLEYHLYDCFEAYYLERGIDLIVPIPLHSSKAWARQFNQSVLLVRDFPRLFRRRHGRKPAWQICPEVICRKRATLSQTGLDGKLREKNLSGAFGIPLPKAVSGKCILLVDDVYTSGATCRSAAQSLLAAGAKQVNVLVLARA